MKLNAHPRLWLLVGIVLVALSACGGTEDPPPLPTRVDAAALAATASALVPTLLPSATPTPSAMPSPTPTNNATAMPSATATVAASPTAPATVNTSATFAAQTATARSAVLPFTQTAEAVYARTATALASVTPSPTPTDTPTPLPGTPRPYEIVFYTNRHGNDDLYLLALDGREYRLTGSAANEREPSCAPDSSALVYASDAGGSWQIYLLPLNGGTSQQLTNSEGMNFAPVFSPDGARIAFVSTRSGIPTIWLMNRDGSDQHQLTTDLGRDTSPSWGPDGQQLLFASDQSGVWDLYLTLVDDTVEGEFPLMPPDFSAANQLWPAFDPNGERVAYSTWADVTDPQSADIYLLDFEQPQPVPVRVGEGADIAWGWGDDTHILASVGRPDDVQIAVINVTSGETVRLTHAGTFNGGARLCVVQPDTLPPEPTLAPSATPTAAPSNTPTPPPTATPTITPTPTVSAFSPELQQAAGQKHVVQPGETLLRISYRYGVPWQTLAQLNSLPDPDRLAVGEQLTVPVTRTGARVSGYVHPDPAVPPRMRTKKLIVVDLSEQTMRAYEDGRLVRKVEVSTGLPETPTVTGQYHIYVKRPAQTMSGPNYYLPDVPWVMYFYQGYGLHGTYWHDNFGQPMSHGCVNLPTEEAKWLYEWAEIGTPVLVQP